MGFDSGASMGGGLSAALTPQSLGGMVAIAPPAGKGGELPNPMDTPSAGLLPPGFSAATEQSGFGGEAFAAAGFAAEPGLQPGGFPLLGAGRPQ